MISKNQPCRWYSLALSALLLLVAAGAGAGDDDAVTGLRQAHDRMARALQHGDVDGLVDCFCDDAVLRYPHRSDIAGREAIRDHIAYVVNLGLTRFRILEDDLFVGTDFIAQSGTCIFYDDAGREGSRSRFLTVWRLEGGHWRIYRDFVS